MKNKLKNSLICFMSFVVIGLLTSCPNPNTANEPKATAWTSVNQTEVDKLLNSPEEIEFEGNKIILSLMFTRSKYRGTRPCGFLFFCPPPMLIYPQRFNFSIGDKINNYNRDFNKRITAITLWIINKQTKFYFKTNKISKIMYPEDLFTDYSLIPPTDYDNENDNNIGIVKFESKDKTFYIKNKIINRL